MQDVNHLHLHKSGYLIRYSVIPLEEYKNKLNSISSPKKHLGENEYINLPNNEVLVQYDQYFIKYFELTDLKKVIEEYGNVFHSDELLFARKKHQSRLCKAGFGVPIYASA